MEEIISKVLLRNYDDGGVGAGEGEEEDDLDLGEIPEEIEEEMADEEYTEEE